MSEIKEVWIEFEDDPIPQEWLHVQCSRKQFVGTLRDSVRFVNAKLFDEARELIAELWIVDPNISPFDANKIGNKVRGFLEKTQK